MWFVNKQRNLYPPHYRAAFASSRFRYPHRHGPPYGFLPLNEEQYGLTLFRWTDAIV